MAEPPELPLLGRMTLPLVTPFLAPGGSRSRLSILIYHRVIRERDPLQPDIPTAVEFDWQMRLMARHFNVLPLSVAVRKMYAGELPSRAACITFDDGYADNQEVALPILERHGLTASFFVAVGFLNGGRMFNDTVIESVRSATGEELDLTGQGLSRYPIASFADRSRAIQAILTRIKALPLTERQQHLDAILGVSDAGSPKGLMMSDAQVQALARAGMEIGGHTVNHPILASLDLADATREIVTGKRELEALIDAPVTTFAYPNGRPGEDYLPEHVEAARDAGFDCAVSTAWGVSTAQSHPYQLPRFTPWDKTPGRFAVRMLRNCTRVRPTLC